MPQGELPVVNPDGELVYVPADKRAAALAAGYRLPTASERGEVVKREKYGQGFGNELRAGLEGAARGLTFGASDVAMRALGVDKEGLEERKARNPYAEGIGEAAGIGVGTLGTGGLAEGLGLGIRGVAAGAEAAGSVASRALASAGVKGIANRAVAGTVSGALEGGAYGLGTGITEATLGEPEDVANTLLAHATMGGLFGGVLGAAGGVLGGVIRGRLDDLAAKRAAGVADAARAPGPQAPLGDFSERAKAALQDLAGEQSLDALGLDKRAYRELQKDARALPGAEGAEALEKVKLLDEAKRIVREQRIVQAGDTVESAGARLRAVQDNARADASRLVQAVDAKAGQPLFDLNEYADKLATYAKKFEDSPEQRKEYRELLERAGDYRELAAKRAGAEGVSAGVTRERDQLQAQLRRVQDNPGRNPAAAQERMRSLQEKIDALPQNRSATGTGHVTLAEAEQIKRSFDGVFTGTSAAKQIARESRGIFNSQVEATFKAAATPEEYAAWRQAKRTQEALHAVNDANLRKQAGMQANRKISLTDYLTGLGSVGAAMGHPGAAAVGFGGSLVHKFVRERGNAFVADFAGRAADAIGGVEGARLAQINAMANGQAQVQKSIVKGVDGFVNGLRNVPKVAKPAAVKAAHEVTFSPNEKRANSDEERAGRRHLEQLSQLINDPETMRVRLAESLGDLQTAAPRVSAEMHFQAQKAMAYLGSKVPKNTFYAATEDLRDKWEPSPAEVRSFERTLRAVHDPVGTVRDMANGHVTREGIEALANVYPTLHEQVINELTPRLAQAKDVPLQRRLELGEIFGVHLDSLSSPQLGATIAKSYAGLQHQAAAPARPAVSKNFAAQQATTPLQRALQDVG